MKSRRGVVFGLASLLGLTLGGVCLLVCGLVAGLAFFGPALYQGLLARSSLQVGQTAPDFQLPTLSGETVRLSHFRGQPVLLTIGASWCIDCRREAPLLQDLHERQPELIILMVDTEEDARTVQAFADEFGLTFPIALDRDGSVAQMYRVLAIPTELLIDEHGVIQARIIERVTAERLTEMLAVLGLEP